MDGQTDRQAKFSSQDRVCIPCSAVKTCRIVLGLRTNNSLSVVASHLVRCRHFRPHDKDGGHTIRSAVSENPMLHANITTICFIERETLTIEILHCGNRDFGPFWLLWSWPWPDDLHTWTWPVFPGNIPHVRIIWTSCVKTYESYRLTDIETDRQTHRQDWNYIPRRIQMALSTMYVIMAYRITIYDATYISYA